MKKIRWMLAILLILATLLPLAAACAAGTTASLTMRLSTRTGPSTAYTEPGTFFSSSWQHTSVSVLSKAYKNGVCWLQVEFTNGGKLYRAYTGSQRIDLDVSLIPEEQALGDASFTGSASCVGRYGPGSHYAAISEVIPHGVSGTVIASENGWLQFDFYDDTLQKQRRVWLESHDLSTYWYGNPPASSVVPPPQSSTGNYYCVNDVYTWCQITNLVSAGGYSSINFWINGVCQYRDVPVYMHTPSYGTFTVPTGYGNIHFNGNQLFFEFFLTQNHSGNRFEMIKLPHSY